MDCHRAQKLIDLRMQETREPPTGEPRDWSELDAHLATCPKCAADWRSLSGVGRLLDEADSDAPTRREIDSMWAAIQSADVPRSAFKRVPRPKGRFRRLLVPGAGIAAVLIIAASVAVTQLGDRVGGTFMEVTGSLGEIGLSRARFGNPEVGLDQETSVYTARSAEPSHIVSMLNGRYTVSAASLLAAVEPPGAAAIPIPADAPGRFDVGKGAFMYDRKGALGAQAGSSSHESDGVQQAPVQSTFGGRQASRGRGSSSPRPQEHTAKGKSGNSRERRAFSGRWGGAGGGAYEEAQSAQAEPDEDAAVEPSPAPQPVRTDAKIIKTGQLEVEVESYRDAVEKVEQIVGRFGGFVADVVAKEGQGRALAGRVVIRVRPERFEELFDALKSVGRLESENVKAADVTAEYVDLEARIHSHQLTEQRLQELVKNKSIIDKVSSLLEVERELTRVRSKIEQLQGQLRVMADRVGMSTIAMTLREPSRTVPSASLSVEVVTVDEAAAALGGELQALGGRLRSGKTSKRSDGTLLGSYDLMISLAKFGDLLATIESLGRIEERQVTNRRFADASAPWADEVECYVTLKLFERSLRLPSATIRLEVADVDAALKKLDEALARCTGSVVSNVSTRQDDGSTVSEIKVQVPAGRFPELIDALDALGRTTARSAAGEAGRIVGGAADVPCEVSLTLAERRRQVPTGTMSLEVSQFDAARERLSALIATKRIQVRSSSSSQRPDGTWMGRFHLAVKAGDMEEVVSQVQGLGRVSSRQTSGLGLGDLSQFDADALSALDVYIAEKAAIMPEPNRAGDSIRASLRNGLAGFNRSIGLIAQGLMIILPWLVTLVQRRRQRSR